MSNPSGNSTNSTTPLLAKPVRRFFDPWNSSSTGHQRADNRLAGSTSWRESRSLKLGEQFGGGSGGGRRVADTVGAGSEDFGKDGRLENGGWARGAPGLRERGQLSVLESFHGKTAVKKPGVKDTFKEKPPVQELDGEERLDLLDIASAQPEREEHIQELEPEQVREQEQDEDKPTSLKTPQIFAGICIYLNGSTAPLISDHRLKQLLVTHGANLSLHLGRRAVTHVILGRPNGSASASASGAGGGLAASKMQKEIAKIGGRNVKFVTAEWVIESIRNGKRAPEQRFEAVRLAPKGSGRVGEMFAKAAKKG